MNPDVIVVGGGVVGCSAAYFLAREGARVTLMERGDIAGGASGAAAGMLAPICESQGEGPFFELGLRSLEMFPALVEELRERSGVDPQYEPCGILRVALDDEAAADLRQQAARLADYGLDWLDAGTVREREPLVSSRLRGALWSPREGHVFSPFMTRAYASAALSLGAAVETGVTVVDLLREGDRVVGVRTKDADRHAGHVVLAGGAWGGQPAGAGMPRLPIEPVRGQILSLQAPQPGFATIIWGEDAYLVPKRNGSLVVGSTEERVGFDCRVTAGGIAGLLEAAPRLVPSLADCTFQGAWAGLRPDTPDHLPLIGPAPGLEGLTLAAGHYRNGVMLSPITGTLLAGSILRGEFPDEFSTFLPRRLLR